MLRNFLLLVAGIIALNMLLLAGFAVSNARDASRKRREIRELESLWSHRRGARDRSRSRAQRVAGVVLVAIVLGATTALASPQGRGVLTSVLGIVSRGLHGQPAEQAAPEVDGDRSPPSAAGEGSGSQVSGGGSFGERDGIRPAPFPPPAHGPAGQAGGNDSQGGPVTPPGAPTAVTAVAISSSQVRVDWFGVAKESGYRVERLKEGGTDWTWVTWVGENVTATVDAELDAGTTYYYRVFSTDQAGDSPASSVASATTGVDPASPTTVTAVATSENQIELIWTDVGNETGYRVERMVVGDADWFTIATTGVDIVRFTDADLQAGTTYHYRVFATNLGGDSAPSEVVVATTSSAPLVEP